MYDLQEIITYAIKSDNHSRRKQVDCIAIAIATLFIHKYFGDDVFKYEKDKLNALTIKWVKNNIGETLAINDYRFDYEDVFYCVANDVDPKDLFLWYEDEDKKTLQEYIASQITN